MITKSRIVFLAAVALAVTVGSGVRGAEPVLKFKGSASHVAAGTPDALQVAGNAPLTVEGWMRFSALKAGDFLYAKRNDRPTTAVYSYMFGVLTSGTLLSAYTGNGGSPSKTWRNVTVSPALQTGRWYHLAFSFDGINLVYYLDGVSVGTNAFSFGNYPAHPVTIGGYTDTTDVNGNVCDVRVWNYARSAAQIQGSKNRRLKGDEAGLLGYWPMNEGEGLQTFDATAAASTGTVVNADWQWDNTLDLLSTGGYLLALPFSLADPDTGSRRFTNSNRVDIVALAIPAGYDQFQFTESGVTGALGAWNSTNAMPADYTFTYQPSGETNLVLYAWFTNSTGSVALRRSEGDLFFTTVKPEPRVKATLARSLRDGETTVVIAYSDINDGTTGGVADGVALTFNQSISCAADHTPEQPYVTLDAVGVYDVVLLVTNEAGNVASVTSVVTVVTRDHHLYVSAGGDNSTGKTWQEAYPTLQAALNAAASNDTIHLAGETFWLTNQIDWTTSGITIRGGYEATETDPAKLPGTNNPALWPTVIARQNGTTRLIYINGASNSTLEQVALTGGNADTGNGLRINNSLNVRLAGCSISNNVSTSSGTAGRGGGIYAIASGLTLTNCVVSGNRVNLSTPSSSSVYGGGIYSEGGSLTLYDSKILNNDATCWFNSRGDGGGVYCSGTVKMKNVLLAGNLANRYGGGICVSGGTASLENCTIADNLETGLQRTGGTISLINSIVWGHPNDIVGTSITVSYSAVGMAGYDGVNGNIGADPLFEYGYHLAAGSPCIGEGSISAGNLGLTAYTTRTDGAPYASGDATVTMGFHQMPGTVFDRTYADVYVSLAGDDSNSGTLVLSPFRTMTQALAVAQDGTRIHVATGRYARAVGVTAGEAFPLMLENRVGVQIIGTDAAETVFDALGSGARVMDLICAHRIEMSGVTITGGSVAFGAGLHVDRCLGVSLSGVTIADNVYYANSGGSGGGIWAQSSAMTLGDCTVRSNSVTAWTTASSRAFGGGVWFRYGRLTMRNCSIVGNTAYNRLPGWAYGGGVHRDGNAVLDLRNVLFAGNSVAGAPTADHGSGLYTAAGGSVLMENCTVTDNTLGGIRCDGSPITLLNSIVWGNGTYDLSGTYTSVSFSDVGTAGYAGVNDNISANPTFQDAAKGDYRLLLGSPAIDKGQSQDWMDDAVDLDGNPRVSMAGVDMGCYELQAPAGTVILIR